MPPKSSLASLLGTLTNAAPVDFDPEALDADQAGPSTFANGNGSASASEDDDDDEEEEEDGAGSEDEQEYTNPRAHYADVGSSDMRKKAALSESDRINDARYQGVKSSRAELYADDDDDEEEEEEVLEGESEDDDDEEDSEDDEEMEQDVPAKRAKQLRFADDASSSSSSSSSSSDNEDDLQPGTSTTTSIAAQIAQSASQAKALKARRLEDAEKGRQVRKQMKTFERALETRIKAQSVLREVNRLPDPSVYTQAISSSSKALQPAISLLEQLLELSQVLFSLRTRLDTLSSSSEDQHGAAAATTAPTTRKRKRDFDVTLPEDEEEAQRTWSEITSHHQIDATLSDITTYSTAMEPHRRAVLDKWSLKVTSAAAATAASNGNKFTQLRAVNQTPSSQIDTVLAGDGLSRLISRTRVLRSDSQDSYKLGRSSSSTKSNSSEEVQDVEVFDDSDFYSTLLKELIERRSGMIPSAEGATTTAMILAGLNGGNKKNFTLDTRASKGRKLRYEVNEKIANFMPPIKDRIHWEEHQIERLFTQLASSSIAVVKEANETYEEKAEEKEEMELDGLRVFG